MWVCHKDEKLGYTFNKISVAVSKFITILYKNKLM